METATVVVQVNLFFKIYNGEKTCYIFSQYQNHLDSFSLQVYISLFKIPIRLIFQIQRIRYIICFSSRAYDSNEKLSKMDIDISDVDFSDMFATLGNIFNVTLSESQTSNMENQMKKVILDVHEMNYHNIILCNLFDVPVMLKRNEGAIF